MATCYALLKIKGVLQSQTDGAMKHRHTKAQKGQILHNILHKSLKHIYGVTFREVGSIVRKKRIKNHLNRFICKCQDSGVGKKELGILSQAQGFMVAWIENKYYLMYSQSYFLG